MTKTACDETKTYKKVFSPTLFNQDLWEDWASIMFAFDINKTPSIKIPFSDKEIPVCLHGD